MIWLGPAGIPLVSKERNTLEGIRTVARLGLNAMEIQFVRGIKMNLAYAKECGKVAKELNVKLSIHAPYYINLSSKDVRKVEASKERILASVERAIVMNAEIVVFHPGYYGSLSKEKVFELIKEGCEEIVEEIKGKNVFLGLETTGRVSQFGELEEIIRVCKEVKGCVPVIDWAHVYARNGGKIDYSKILDIVEKLKLPYLHTHFSCIDFSLLEEGKGNERRHLELKAGRPPFKPLAVEILKRKMDVVIISESPILEEDSLRMKEVLEEIGYKW